MQLKKEKRCRRCWNKLENKNRRRRFQQQAAFNLKKLTGCSPKTPGNLIREYAELRRLCGAGRELFEYVDKRRSSLSPSISSSRRSSASLREENPRIEPETQKTTSHQKRRRWWPNRGSAWRTRSTAKTSLSGGTWPSRR